MARQRDVETGDGSVRNDGYKPAGTFGWRKGHPVRGIVRRCYCRPADMSCQQPCECVS